MVQANWKLPVQQFQTWIWRERVTASQGDYTAGLDDFVPAGEVEAYLRQSGKLRAILNALFGDGGGDIDARQILTRYSVVFAILVSVDHGEYIGNFLPYDSLCDARLPFSDRPARFPLVHGGSNVLFDRFQAAQARFCASKFTGGHHKFEREERLPFLEKKLVGEGGSAKVYRVKIHAKHDDLHRPGSLPELQEHHKHYALKAYDGVGGERWHGIETATFKKLHHTGLDDSHMIGYYCSYEHRGVCYALLEYADMDTLEHFMMRESSGPPSTNAEILSFWENLLHVIEAIGEIHDLDTDSEYSTEPVKFTCIHQDIKPRNILVKTKEHASSIYDSAFGLADLGTSSLIRAETEPNHAARDNYGTKTYGSPECYRKDSVDEKRNIKITTKADIWSLGCVLSEVCVWVVFGVNGPHGLKSYRQRRENFNRRAPRGADCFHCNGKESQAVIDEHRKVAEQYCCDPVTRGILKLMPKMLHLEADQRPSAPELRNLFVEIIDDVKRGPSPSPKSRSNNVTPTYPKSRTRSTTGGSSTPSSPLGARVNKRLTGQFPHENSFSSTSSDYGATRTETPRTITMESDMRQGHDGTSSAVAGASRLLAEQIQTVGRPMDITEEPLSLPHLNRRSEPVQGQNIGVKTPVVPSSSVQDSRPENTRCNETQRKLEDNISPTSNHAPELVTAENRPMVRPEAPATTHPSPPNRQGACEPPVKLTFKDALEWKQRTKAGRSVKRLPDQNLLIQLKGRDHVFVVDDCKSMGGIRAANRASGQSEVTDYVDVLSYIVKRHDPDGVDLHYFNSPEVIKRCREATRLAVSVRGTPFEGLSNPEGVLQNLLKTYLAKLRAWQAKVREFDNRGRKSIISIHGIPKPPTPLSIYVFTDGVWESPSAAGGGYLEDTLKELIEVLRSAGSGRDQIGIQFIRFGSHEHGVQRLEGLDRLGSTNGTNLDIVDTEPVEDGNVWKMLLGAINPRFDAD